MGNRKSDEAKKADALKRAVALMMEALDTINGFEGSAAAAAHLEMAIATLREGLPEES